MQGLGGREEQCGMEHLGEVSLGRVDETGLSRMGGINPEEPEGAEKSMRWVRSSYSMVNRKESAVFHSCPFLSLSLLISRSPETPWDTILCRDQNKYLLSDESTGDEEDKDDVTSRIFSAPICKVFWLQFSMIFVLGAELHTLDMGVIY